eukprot:1666048-Rhodomonas_salina.4
MTAWMKADLRWGLIARKVIAVHASTHRKPNSQHLIPSPRHTSVTYRLVLCAHQIIRVNQSHGGGRQCGRGPGWLGRQRPGRRGLRASRRDRKG